MLLGAESKRVQRNGIGDSSGTETSVAIPNLVAGEVLEIPGCEPIGTVEDDLDLGVGCGTSCSLDNGGWCGTTGIACERARTCEGNGGTNPHKLLNGVVEVKADGVVGTGTAGRLLLLLELIDEVLVGVLGELATLGCVEVDVVGVHSEVGGGQIACSGASVDVGGSQGELNVELDFVVLERNKGNGKTGVPAEPEAHGDVRLCRCGSGCGDVASSLVGVCHPLVLGGLGNTVGAVDDWLRTGNTKLTLLTGGVELCQVAPDGKPQAVLAIDQLTSDFDFKNLEESVGKIAGELGRSTGGDQEAGVVLNPQVLEKISVTGDCDGHTGTGGNGAIDGLLNGLNGEVGVAAVNGLEESNLGLTSQVDVLGAVGNELHKTSSHF